MLRTPPNSCQDEEGGLIACVQNFTKFTSCPHANLVFGGIYCFAETFVIFDFNWFCLHMLSSFSTR